MASLIDDIIERGLRELAERDPRIVAMLVDSYAVAWRRIEAGLRRLDAQIADAVRRGVDVNDAWLHRQQWWRELQDSIEREMIFWHPEMMRGVATLQQSGVTVAVTGAGMIASAAGSSFQGRVYAEAFEHWVTALRPGSPLADVLDRYDAAIQQSIRQRMTEGIGSGRNNRTIVQAIRADVGVDAMTPFIVTLARTETMRAYRGASAGQFEQLRKRGVVSGYVWLAELSPRTCLACIARHGTFFTEPPDDFHPRCRCVLRPVTDAVAGGRWRGETGPAWFAKQPEHVQRAMMVSPQRYEMYRDGMPLSAMVGTRHSETWGDSMRIRGIGELKRSVASWT